MQKKARRLAAVFLCCLMLHHVCVPAFAEVGDNPQPEPGVSDSVETTDQPEETQPAQPPEPAPTPEPTPAPTPEPTPEPTPTPVPTPEPMPPVVEGGATPDAQPTTVPIEPTITSPPAAQGDSVSCGWDGTTDSQPVFSCQPVWNPKTHSYDQWKFMASNPLVVCNTSVEGSTIVVEVSFHSDVKADGRLALSADEEGQASLEITLVPGEQKDIYLSISGTESLWENNNEVCIGTISCRITEVVAAEKPSMDTGTVDVPKPTVSLTPEPSVSPTPEPSVLPTPEPSVSPTPEPSVLPAPEPSVLPEPEPPASPEPEPPASPEPEPPAAPEPLEPESADSATLFRREEKNGEQP